jgi:hypothetical protein
VEIDHESLSWNFFACNDAFYRRYKEEQPVFITCLTYVTFYPVYSGRNISHVRIYSRNKDNIVFFFHAATINHVLMKAINLHLSSLTFSFNITQCNKSFNVNLN